LDNDKAFTLYAAILIGSILSVLTASVLAGVAALPTPLVFAEHLAMSLIFRAAYKSLAGPGWYRLPTELSEVLPAVEVPAPAAEHGVAAKAA
jgi:hypothetical protein